MCDGGGGGQSSERQCLYIKFGIFGKHMNECISGFSLVSAWEMCEHLNVFL